MSKFKCGDIVKVVYSESNDDCWVSDMDDCVGNEFKISCVVTNVTFNCVYYTLLGLKSASSLFLFPESCLELVDENYEIDNHEGMEWNEFNQRWVLLF